jgi:hypothetical protein
MGRHDEAGLVKFEGDIGKDLIDAAVASNDAS